MIDCLYPMLRGVLFRLDAETAHHLTIDGLRVASALGWDRLLEDASAPAQQPVQAMGLTFPNRLGLAAGLDKAGVAIDGFGAMGFGHVEVGTITPRPQPGNPRPRLWRIVDKEAIVNRMGFNNPGLHAALANISTRRWPGIVGFNIGKNFDTPNEAAIADYRTCLAGAYAHVDYVTVNISSPNTKGLRDLQQEDAIRALMRALKQDQGELAARHGKYTPIAVKIAPDLDPDALKAIAAISLEEKIDGLIATNTTIGREGVEHSPIAREAGGLSGAPVREKSTAILRALRAEVGPDFPLIGVGGIFSGTDALAKLEAGATLIQIYTGLIYRGPAMVREILAALASHG